MSDWIRELIRPSDAPLLWHVARDKGLTTTTNCGEKYGGPIEVTSSDDRLERDGRCSTCEMKLAEKQTAIGASTAR